MSSQLRCKLIQAEQKQWCPLGMYFNYNSLDHVSTEEILCVHGDKVRYPTAEVKLRLGQWLRTAKVMAALCSAWDRHLCTSF